MFKDALKTQLEAKEWGAGKLSDELGMSLNSVNNWLSGAQTPTYKTIILIAQKLDISPGLLFK